MVRIIMSGCNGYMGRVVTEIVAEDENAEIVAGIDLEDKNDKTYPVFTSIADCDVEADAVIDFSSPKALDGLLAYCTEKKVPAVFCTTGYSQEQMEQIRSASEQVAVMKSANMSLGVNMLLKLIQDAAKLLAPAGFDMEIVEKHHNLKVDAPSGTALALADSLNEALDQKYDYKYDRTQERKRRDRYEIGISSVRGGNIVGEHEVIFAGLDEVIEFKHTAYSKRVFAKGAVQAAKFMTGKPAGMYDMADVIAEV
ncbi:MAG: 4-hydroxy-tetrahydrodipicolinate reductase [Candidatus Choladocola sp.]|nr:4-hydroxy-tetrahydrodipicolinate reductase [Candidatus Choladocola sp.]